MPVICAVRDGILLLTIVSPPVNALSQVERAGLVEGIGLATADADIEGVVIIGEGSLFCGGSDLREFDLPPAPPQLPEVIAAVEACAKPVIAAIAGPALGGGFELALGCHFRIAVAGARLGLPEVTLGIVPGAGGTQRLPRLIDPVDAAAMVSSGRAITAAEALRLGIVDRIVEDDLAAAAIALAHDAATTGIADRRLSRRHPADSDRCQVALDDLAKTVRQRSRGATAPNSAIELVRLSLQVPFAEGMTAERSRFLAMRSGPEAGALRHIFFAEREAAKPPADIGDMSAMTVTRVGIVGAGTMGTGIAMTFADAGLPVTLVETSPTALERGLGIIRASYATAAARGRTSSEDAVARVALIEGTTDYNVLSDTDLIIEAAFESMEVKRDIFRRLDALARPGAILATNTSYLDLDAIAAETRRPADVVGMHYFSPANVMRLLEVVRGRQSGGQAIATAFAVAKRTGKIPVISGVCPGFVGNRMLKAYVREAGLLLIEGATPSQIDAALETFGMAMGPFAVADLAGIDIGYKARQALPPGSYDPLATTVHDRLVEGGHLGQKSGSGFYLYQTGRSDRPPNPALAGILQQCREGAGVVTRAVGPKEIVDRCMDALLFEGQAIVRDGIAARPGDIDVVYVNGYGFPRHRGGPMYYGRQQNLAEIVTRVDKYSRSRFGSHWKPEWAREQPIALDATAPETKR